MSLGGNPHGAGATLVGRGTGAVLFFPERSLKGRHTSQTVYKSHHIS